MREKKIAKRKKKQVLVILLWRRQSRGGPRTIICAAFPSSCVASLAHTKRRRTIKWIWCCSAKWSFSHVVSLTQRRVANERSTNWKFAMKFMQNRWTFARFASLAPASLRIWLNNVPANCLHCIIENLIAELFTCYIEYNFLFRYVCTIRANNQHSHIPENGKSERHKCQCHVPRMQMTRMMIFFSARLCFQNGCALKRNLLTSRWRDRRVYTK